MTSSFQPLSAPEAEAGNTLRADRQVTIAIIGLGRVGTVLGRALHRAGYRIAAVSSRDAARAQATAHAFDAVVATPLAAACGTDLTLLAVSDDAIATLAAELAEAGAWRDGQFVIHASGALPANVLAPAAKCGAAIGSFHPLAAIASPDMALPSGLTFAIEGSGALHTVLVEWARALGGHPLDLDPADKTLYHAAAVIASNYTVTLAAFGTEILERLGADQERGLRALLPLMRSTLDNLERQGLPAALTGPLVRGDVGTVQRHLAALDQAASHVAEMYRCLAHGTLPLAQRRGLTAEQAGALQDLVTLPGEMIAERES